MEADGLIQVFDVYKIEATFEAFGKTLLPIMKDLEKPPRASRRPRLFTT